MSEIEPIRHCVPGQNWRKLVVETFAIAGFGSSLSGRHLLFDLALSIGLCQAETPVHFLFCAETVLAGRLRSFVALYP